MITITDFAIEQMIRIAEDERLPPRLRIKVVGGGCAGFKYDLFFEETEPNPTDEVFERDGISVLVDVLSLQYLDGTEIDYVKQEFQEGFKVNNPNITKTCGCGSSFQ